MVNTALRFFRPTTAMRELFVLLSLDGTQTISQHELARRVGLSSSMAHNYMADLVCQELVAVSGLTNRSMTYRVTPKGRARLAELLRGYAKEIARLYSIAKVETEKRLQELYAQGLKSLVLFGAAETGELVYHAAKTTPVRIVGWVDNDATKHRLRFGRLRVCPPETIESYRPDGVLIASSGDTEDIYRQIRHLPAKGIPIVTL